MSIDVTKDKSKLMFNRDGVTAVYDLADGSCYNHKGKQVKSLNSFFVNKRIHHLRWSDTNYKKLIELIDRNETQLCSIGSLLTQLRKYQHCEGYILLGLPVSKAMSHPISYYPKAVRKFLIDRFQGAINEGRGSYNNPARKLKDWLYYFENGASAKLTFLKLIQDLEMEELLNDIAPWELTALYDMTNDYSMNPKAMLLQIEQYHRREGLTYSAVRSNLSDYNSMSKTMNDKYHKYPKYLLSTHQIIVMNYNSFQEEYEESAFTQSVDTKLAHKGTTYSVITPKLPSDVQQEGADQNHCVATYVSRIIDGNTQIVFMRNNNKLDKSLLTIEVKDERIVQVKGSYNRQATEDEMKFIITYAKLKKLSISKYL